MAPAKKTTRKKTASKSKGEVVEFDLLEGKFKDELLFYLMSRGISFNKSNELLMESLLINNGNKEEKVVQEFIKIAF